MFGLHEFRESVTVIPFGDQRRIPAWIVTRSGGATRRIGRDCPGRSFFASGHDLLYSSCALATSLATPALMKQAWIDAQSAAKNPMPLMAPSIHAMSAPSKPAAAARYAFFPRKTSRILLIMFIGTTFLIAYAINFSRSLGGNDRNSRHAT